jgi:transmembrane sensor
MARRSSNSPPTSRSPDDDDVARWLWRLDRGLTPGEQDQFFQWLAADPAHAAALQRCRAQWSRFNQLADWRPEHSDRPNPDLLAPAPARSWRRLLWPLALAAALVLAGTVYLWRPPRPGPAAETSLSRHEDRRILPDRSATRLNAGANLTVLYSPAERRVRLDQGEAFFTVVPDATRPFVVEAGTIEVRALGTAFNVRLSGSRLDVIVTAGTVALAASVPVAAGSTSSSAARAEIAVLQANQRLNLSLTAGAPVTTVESIAPGEIQRRLSWQHGLMNFRDESLDSIVADLNRINATQVLLRDEALATTRFSGTIRSDNVAGFVRLLESAFGAEIVKSTSGEIQLRSKPPAP